MPSSYLIGRDGKVVGRAQGLQGGGPQGPRDAHRPGARHRVMRPHAADSPCIGAPMIRPSLVARRLRAARRSRPGRLRLRPAPTLGEGQPRQARDVDGRRSAGPALHAAHLRQQGSRVGRLRRRRGWLWLQLTRRPARAATRPAPSSPRALALPGRAGACRQRAREAASWRCDTCSYKDSQPGLDRISGERAVDLRAGAAVAAMGGGRLAGLRQRLRRHAALPHRDLGRHAAHERPAHRRQRAGDALLRALQRIPSAWPARTRTTTTARPVRSTRTSRATTTTARGTSASATPTTRSARPTTRRCTRRAARPNCWWASRRPGRRTTCSSST